MKKSLATLLLLAPLTLGLTGCIIVADGDGKYNSSVDHEDRERDNRSQIANLTLNTPIDQVKTKFGVPDFNETYTKDGETIQVLFYRTMRKHSDGMTTKDECTPLLFKDGVLTSWGDTALQQL